MIIIWQAVMIFKMSYRVFMLFTSIDPIQAPPFIPHLRGGSLLAGRDIKTHNFNSFDVSHNFVRFQVFHLLYLLSLMIKSISRLSSSFIKSLMLTKPLLKRSCNPVSLIFISAATSFKYLLSLRTSLLTHVLNATGSANFSAAFHSFSVGFSNFTLSPLSLRVYSYVSTPSVSAVVQILSLPF